MCVNRAQFFLQFYIASQWRSCNFCGAPCSARRQRRQKSSRYRRQLYTRLQWLAVSWSDATVILLFSLQRHRTNEWRLNLHDDAARRCQLSNQPLQPSPYSGIALRRQRRIKANHGLQRTTNWRPAGVCGHAERWIQIHSISSAQWHISRQQTAHTKNGEPFSTKNRWFSFLDRSAIMQHSIFVFLVFYGNLWLQLCVHFLQRLLLSMSL